MPVTWADGRFLDTDAIDRAPLVGPVVSLLAENGWAEGRAFRAWMFDELERRNVRTFADLEINDDPGRDPRGEHRWRLTVTSR